METLAKLAGYLEQPLVSHIFTSILIVITLTVIEKMLLKVIDKRVKSSKSLYGWKKAVSYSLVFMGVIIIGRIWIGGFTSVVTYFGLLSAGVAIALKDMLANLAGWVFIMWRKPFKVGDRIQIGDTAGDVIDLRPFQFTLMEMGKWVRADQPTGRFVFMPNGVVFSQPVINYDTGFKYIWNEITVTISFNSNWQRAREIILASTQQHCMQVTAAIEKEIKLAVSKYYIIDSKLQPDVFVSIADNGISLIARYLTEVRSRRATSEAIQTDILTEFAKTSDLTFADVNSLTLSINSKD